MSRLVFQIRKPGLAMFGLALVPMIAGSLALAIRFKSLWDNPYQFARVWQSFSLGAELERVGWIPWRTELSTMSGGLVEVPFLQEFPFTQYLMVLVRLLVGLPVAEAGQLAAGAIAVCAVIVWWLYSARVPASPPIRILVAGLILTLPGFVTYGPTAVPDAPVFLFNLAGCCLLFTGRRQNSGRMLIGGAILVGLSTLLKTNAAIVAAIVGIALVQEKRWSAAAALCVAMLPGVAWALTGRAVNPLAAPVNEMARTYGNIDWWWNPRLYVDPWWYRFLAYTVYNMLGVFWIASWAVAAIVAIRRRCTFELLIILAAPFMFILAFNYHSATHAYYDLVWLPLVLVGTLEIALKAIKAPSQVRRHGYALGIVMVLAGLGASLGMGERAFGSIPRATGYHSLVRSIEETAPQRTDEAANAAVDALVRATKEVDLVAYMGDSGAVAFTELGRRGWVVSAPISEESEYKSRRPKTVYMELEWRRVGTEWFRDRVARGLSVVLIEENSLWDATALQHWAEGAGFRVTGSISGHTVLIR